MTSIETTSTRPYLIRALYEWCTDNGLTPYVAVSVDESVQVPREYVKNNEIVLNISFDATSSLNISNDFIEFKARFAGSSRDIMVPMARVTAIYARESGQGMSFPMAIAAASAPRSEESAVTPPFALVVASPDSSKSAPASSTNSLPDSKVVQLAPSGNSDPPKPPSRPDPGSRPSLKRVK